MRNPGPVKAHSFFKLNHFYNTIINKPAGIILSSLNKHTLEEVSGIGTKSGESANS